MLDMATPQAAPSAPVRFSDDSAASGGRQLITFDKTGHAAVLFIAGTAYLRACLETQ